MKKSNDSFFSISDFARITNVTPETLRHYHRIGLLSPSYTDPETNYRYYSMMEFECIGVIQALQSLGISLNEIKQYLKLKNVSYSFALLSEQYINVCNQLDSLSLTKKYLKEKIDTMNMLINQSTLNKIIIKKIHKRYGYTITTPCKTYKEYQLSSAKLMERYDKNLFLSNSFAIICRTNQSLSSTLFYSLIMNINKPKKIKCQKRNFPAQQYVTMQFQGTFENSKPSLQKMFQYINKNGYSVCGEILMLCLVDENYTNIASEKITEIQIPIK